MSTLVIGCRPNFEPIEFKLENVKGKLIFFNFLIYIYIYTCNRTDFKECSTLRGAVFSVENQFRTSLALHHFISSLLLQPFLYVETFHCGNLCGTAQQKSLSRR